MKPETTNLQHDIVPCVVDQGEELIAFPTLFRQQVALTPGRLAVVHENRELTYADLHDMTTQFAAELQQRGIGKGSCVGLCMDRSPEAIAAMLGVLTCGAAFVPLDPEYPVDRLAYMVSDASIRVVIAGDEYRKLLETGLAQASESVQHDIQWIPSTPSADSGKPNDIATLARVHIDPADMAYVMYTSGSTGKPKGVQIQHSALATYCFADIDIYEVVASDRTLQFSTLNFDIAIEEIFPPLLTGSCIVIRPLGRSERQNELSDIVNRHDVTAIHLATAYWHEWVDLMVASNEKVPASIRLMIVTGEKVCVEHYRRWQQICDHEVLWCNAYGPTEATVSATVFIPDETFDAPNMPIGKPMKRYDAFILNDKMTEVADGETGQLFVGGPALALGYLNRPDLTEKAFVDVKLHGELRKLYRTGDLARWLPNGDIDFGGRIDHQIKLGSYRIEPGEIEAALDQHSGVMESLVSYDLVDSKKFLIAYIATGGSESNAAELANFLRDRLPPYMIPARYVFVDAFPKTINGKIDRKALPDANTSVVARDSGYVAPRNELETTLAELFQDVLNVPEVGIHDDFFLMGGSSLLVTQVVARLTTKLDLELPVRDFFANPTVASSAKHITSLINDGEVDDEDDSDIIAQRDRLPIIHADYFPSGEHRLFGMRYQPKASVRNHAVLICQPYGSEYQRSYRNLQQFAVQLCQGGFDVLRFDYASTGNSEGDCEQATCELFHRNICDAATYLRSCTGYDRLSIVGLRMGATLAATCDVPNIHKSILWDPMVQGDAYLEMLEQFHDEALTNLVNFSRVRRRSAVDQLFDHRMNAAKRDSFCHLTLPNLQPNQDRLVITSADYASREAGFQSATSNVDVYETMDAIAWHELRHTESAFSSPNICRQMLQFLSGDAK